MPKQFLVIPPNFVLIQLECGLLLEFQPLIKPELNEKCM